jgi:hypothetical protein
MLTVGRASLSTIVPRPWVSAGVALALAGAVRLTKNVSSGSLSRSPVTGTEIVPIRLPAGIVNVPVVAV